MRSFDEFGVLEIIVQEIKTATLATVVIYCFLAMLVVKSCSRMYQMGYDSATR